MKTFLSLLLLVPALAVSAQNRNGASNGAGAGAGVGVGAGAGVRASNPCPNSGSPSDCPVAAINPAQPTSLGFADLTFAIEEERVAHDLYAAAFARWNLRVFSNIAESETRHADALIQLAATVGVQPPPAQPGAYVTDDLRSLYTQLLALVNESETAALQAGALVEETDIADLRRLALQATDEASKAVIARLSSASVNHLSAFVRNLAARGVVYAPQVLSADEFAGMMTAPGGRGGKGGAGMGGGGANGFRGGR